MPRWRNCRCRCGIRDGEGHPHVPAFRPVFCGEFPVALEIQISLLVSNRKQIAELGAEAENARFESVEQWSRANIVSDPLIVISDQPSQNGSSAALGVNSEIFEATGGIVVHREPHWVNKVGVWLFGRSAQLFSGK